MLQLPNAQALEICKKHGLDLTEKRIKMAFGVTARALQRFPATGVSLDELEALDKELKEANR